MASVPLATVSTPLNDIRRSEAQGISSHPVPVTPERMRLYTVTWVAAADRQSTRFDARTLSV